MRDITGLAIGLILGFFIGQLMSHLRILADRQKKFSEAYR